MVEKVKTMLREGKTVKIFTARVSASKNLDGSNRDLTNVIKTIQDWTEKHIGVRLEVTNVKDYGMIELYDDRCVQIVPNTGLSIKEYLRIYKS